jgi:hypothetical protein
MSLRINFWNKVNAKQGAKDVQYRTVLQSLQAIHPDSVLLLRNSSDEPWLGQLIKRGRFSPKTALKFSR